MDETHPPLPDELVPALNTNPPHLSASADPLPAENTQLDEAPPLPPEPVPDRPADDGWHAIFENSIQAYYFWNSITNETTWTNPRLPGAHVNEKLNPEQLLRLQNEALKAQEPEYAYSQRFSRRTGKFLSESKRPENHTKDARARKQLEQFYDIEAFEKQRAGRSLLEERRNMKFPKSQLKELIKKRNERKEARKRGWLMDDDLIPPSDPRGR
ncbi:WW domain-containing protein [Neolecta irregularis DAH-3]|uniref:WW domain-containing protein n=1 Tax=Neolecta irregularis (strain DAH-3) TaxID=1198029 RepID=A0A1U7LGK0_NEOID|nr:WW domain-containing protein [Neolecta irregularis DAH-3]|eukprot:OLL21777.1 WW domain-containing protein [Neolecta irregularis DAH-3]